MSIDKDALKMIWEDDGKPMSFERLCWIVDGYEAAKVPDQPLREEKPSGLAGGCNSHLSSQQPDDCRKLDIGLETIGLTLAHWIEFNKDGNGDDAFVITPPTWPTIGVLKAWIVTLERARTAMKREVVEVYPQKQIFIDALKHILDYETNHDNAQGFVGRCAYTALSRIEGDKS